MVTQHVNILITWRFQPVRKDVYCFASTVSIFIFDAKQKCLSLMKNEILQATETTTLGVL